ncbi:MAG: SCO family protein [Gammaproteobacteria bacterium]|nr:SCO family protein [Gammaproteobacteria bacterium]MBU1555564.1 SCO family protein [Gammaproteobacteria bacterium]MBU2069406.1 SCO family protein [Gammaproteobacteria bacterium]MBU2182911.1 SCO family protein [Gammaproteobacteria bacterium]MBU2203259.1 SCO family protein [Gammaproteobacteria bacterium]
MFRNLAYLFLVLAALAGGVMLYQWSQLSAEPKLALVYPQPRVLADFQLTDQHGEMVNRQRLYGQWTLAFVGYTYCPDICPLTLAKLAGLQPELAAQLPEPLKVWFISVDPKRDTIEKLNEYVSYFTQPAVIGMTAGHDQLFPFVRQLGLMYALSGSTDTDYLVDHSASVVLINPQGQLVAMFKPPLEVGKLPILDSEQMLADFPLVLRKLKAG